MEPYNTFFSIFLDYYKKCVNSGIDVLQKSIVQQDKLVSDSTENTRFPICPWCGNEYKNYEDFYFPDRQELCCKEDTRKTFFVVRYVNNGVITYKTNKR